MTSSDQQLIQQAAAKALVCLARVLEREATGSPRWVLLVEALEALETVEAVADGGRDSLEAHQSLSPPAMRAQRLALTRSLLGRRELPGRPKAA